MMKLFFAALLILLPLFVNAGEKPVVIKSWKTFKSDFGYEFKYPDCWEVAIDDTHGEPPISANSTIFVDESKKCSRAQMDSNAPNGVGFNARKRDFQTQEKTKQSFNNLRKLAVNEANSKESSPVKLFKIGFHDAVAYVEHNKSAHDENIRWHVIYDCPKAQIDLTGPSIRFPPKSYFEKFKAGDLALPEPEKTIIESVRCSEGK